MSVAAAPQLLDFQHTYADALEGLYVPWQGAVAPEPRLLVLNDALARELGADPEALRAPEGVAALAGSVAPAGSRPIAMAYSGHQFGSLSPRLGDGRALLLGEVLDVEGRRRDLHLKGSGRTPFARGGDGKAVVGPMLREHVVGEAMHALGIPTTRALAVVATGERVRRETSLPGAVLARIAASHLRVGTFQYASLTGNVELVRRLADYAIARHHPDAAAADNPYLSLLASVVDVQAALIARWMSVAFVHGVMNSDNMTISGETIDYGPCAFMEAFDPAATFSSIDHGGRYAYGMQPALAQWNLARLAETLLPLVADDQESAVAAVTPVLESWWTRYDAAFLDRLRAKLGLGGDDGGDDELDATLVADLLGLLRADRVDFTTFFRAAAATLRGDRARDARGLLLSLPAWDAWEARWRERLGEAGRSDAGAAATADAMDAINPVYIPRNHAVEDALTAATVGDLAPLTRLVDAVTHPFVERADLADLAAPGPEDDIYVTYCGT
ncbi:MAG TPA: YdiU family protein [Baekduia sp.]|uniref:protein adenylyltransferase SelO n=1 Tax=Baekduia sp. TaxID=2600305 RepID=UPI002D7893FB|nr:YdiU family protein [Baekduia sp.]HET6510320.1 YdiU family protein [Baekduia sp.]